MVIICLKAIASYSRKVFAIPANLFYTDNMSGGQMPADERKRKTIRKRIRKRRSRGCITKHSRI